MIREISNNDNLQIGGKWINKYTGQVINVINNVIDGDNMILVTDKGDLSMAEFENYIQVTDEKMVNDIAESISSAVNDDYSQYMFAEDINYNTPKTNNTVSKKEVNTSQQQQTKQNLMIEKLFAKISNIDKLLNVSFNVDVLPINDLKIVIEYMDLSIDDIASYIINNVFDKAYLTNTIKQQLTKVFVGDLQDDTGEETNDESNSELVDVSNNNEDEN